MIDILSRQDGMRPSLVPHVSALLASDTLAGHVDAARISALVLREVAVGRPVWESRLLDGFINPSPLDEFVRDRAGQSLAHVFMLLSLVLPREALQIAFRSLHSDDRLLAGRHVTIPVYPATW